jgi:hypothetical protein
MLEARRHDDVVVVVAVSKIEAAVRRGDGAVSED